MSDNAPIEQAMAELGAKNDHDLMLMTTALVLTIKNDDIPAILRRLDHTNGGFHDHELRIQTLELCAKLQSKENADTKATRDQVAQEAVTENNRLQANLLKRLSIPISVAIIIGTIIGSIIVPLLEKIR